MNKSAVTVNDMFQKFGFKSDFSLNMETREKIDASEAACSVCLFSTASPKKAARAPHAVAKMLVFANALNTGAKAPDSGADAKAFSMKKCFPNFRIRA